MPLKLRRRLRVLATAALMLVVAGATTLAITFPALAAAACPSCYGLVPVADGLFVEADMTDAQRRELQAALSEAESSVRAYYGQLARHPRIVACANERCDKALGGKGARAVTVSSVGFSVLRLSPRGLNRTILTHELAHVHLHATIGIVNLLRGRVPAWFDEGLAVIVSEDPRYVKPGPTVAERCVAPASAELPASPFAWAPLSGRDPMLYARAACSVAHWIAANGGRAGLIEAIADVAAGRRQLP